MVCEIDMNGYKLGEFEEVVILSVGKVYDVVYRIAIKGNIENQVKRKFSVGALQSARYRMGIKVIWPLVRMK